MLLAALQRRTRLRIDPAQLGLGKIDLRLDQSLKLEVNAIEQRFGLLSIDLGKDFSGTASLPKRSVIVEPDLCRIRAECG